jgi:undecaprenyl pyrophosphate phosphatase UppP
MEFLLSAILGIIQGISEFLPVSSSGHQAAVEQLKRCGKPILGLVWQKDMK